MRSQLLIAAVIVLPLLWAVPITHRDVTSLQNTPIELWALQAFAMLDILTCRQLYLFDNTLCDRIKLYTHRTQMNLYVSDHGNNTVVMPDDSFRHDPHHSLVLGIDPLPKLVMPHIVFIFFLDQMNEGACMKKNGQYYNNHCLYLAQKKQCGNDLNFYCQHKYIPLVHDASDAMRRQNFQCREDILVTANCPQPSQMNKKPAICDAVGPKKFLPSQCQMDDKICQPDIICDYGFIISGGWNEANARISQEESALGMYYQLTKQGFHADSVRIMINNATTHATTSSQQPQSMWGANERSELRKSIRKVCSSEFCADTLVIYLTGVTADDGALLLWDLNQDGVIDKEERYSPFHLLKDTANCKANRVIVIVDSTNTESLISKLSTSKEHDNMIVIGAGRFGQLPDRTFAKVFTQFAGMQFCLAEALPEIERNSDMDSFLMVPGNTNVNVTLTGATCKQHSNLPTKTSGCMQLPSMMWKLFT